MEFLGKEIKVVAVHKAGVEVLRDGYQKILKFQVFGKPKGLEKAAIEGTPDLPWEFNESVYLPPWFGKTGGQRLTAQSDAEVYKHRVELDERIAARKEE